MSIDLICTDSTSLNKVNMGRAVSFVRNKLSYTQAYVAEQTGLTINYLSLVENGYRGLSIDGLNKLADALQIPAYILTSIATPATGPFKRTIAAIQKLCYKYLERRAG